MKSSKPVSTAILCHWMPITLLMSSRFLFWKLPSMNGNDMPLDAYKPAYSIARSGLEVAKYEIKVTAKIAYSSTGEGLYRFVDQVVNQVYLYTKFETADAKRVYACFDQPDMKATF